MVTKKQILEGTKMKNWKNAEVVELNINETASGLFCTDFETLLLFNDNLKKCPQTPQEDPKDPIKNPS